MVECPTCKKELATPIRQWKYWRFNVELYLCDKCHTKFSEYTKDGKHSFTLKYKKGKFRAFKA